MAASEYGLSIVLDFEDNASAGMKSAESTFSSLSGSADKLTMSMGSTADSLLDLNTSVVGMSVMGSQLQNMGQGLLGILGSVGGQVIKTGSNFESFKLTLDALYGSSVAAGGVINDLFKYAVKSPYNVTDLQDMVVTLKSQGLEAFDVMTNASNGFAQSTMDWIGDLQAFRPGVAASRWKLALQNFLSGTDTQSARVLRNILDVGDLATYVGHDLGTTVTERFQTLMDLVTKMNMAGMQSTLQRTWSVTLANMGDAWEQFAYRLGFGNKDTGLYQNATEAAQNVLSIMTDIFTNNDVINSVSNALNGLVAPIERVTAVASGLAPAFSNWLGLHPQITSFATGLTAVSGVALVAGGSLLKLSSGVMNWMLNVQRLGGLTGVFNMLGNSITALTYRMAGVGSVGLMAYLAWKNNVLGIRDLLLGMGGEVKSVFSTVVTDVSTGNKTITESLNAQGFTQFTQGLVDLRAIAGETGEYLYDGFTKVFELFGANLPDISNKTFSLKQVLNDFGENLSDHFSDIGEFGDKYKGLIMTIGSIGGAFLTTLAASTLLSGGIKTLSSGFGALMTNFRVITNTLMSPIGLLGVGVATLTAGYYENFLGLQDVVTPVVDRIRDKIDQLRESFSQKDTSGKNSILSALTNKMQSLYESAKTWRSGKLLDNISFVNGHKTTYWNDEGVSIGTLLANGVMTGLMLFRNPIQKALGFGMLAVSHNVGNIQDGLYNIVDDFVHVKDLLVEMSTGYGAKSKSLAEQYGLTDFAEGVLDLKNSLKSMGVSFLEGTTEANNTLGNWIRDVFPSMDLSIKGILNGLGTMGTRLNGIFNTDSGKSFVNNMGEFASQLAVASGASAVLTGTLGIIFRFLTRFNSLGLGLTSALVNPFTLGTVAIMAYQRDFGEIRTKINEFIEKQRTVAGLALAYQNQKYATRFNDDGTQSLVDIEAVNSALDTWKNKSELISSAWSGIKTGIKSAVSDTASVLSALFNFGGDGYATLLEKFGTAVLGLGGFDQLKQKLDASGQSFSSIATKAIVVAGAFGMLSAASRILGVNLDPVNAGLSLMNKGFELIKSGAAQSAMGVIDGLMAFPRSGAGALSRTFGLIRDLFVEGFSGRGGNALTTIGGLGADLMTSLRSSFTLLSGGLFRNIANGGIGQAITNAFSEIDTSRVFSNWKNGFSNIWNSFRSNIGKNFSGISNYMSTTWGSAINRIRDTWTGFGNSMGFSFNSLRNRWNALTHGMVVSLQSWRLGLQRLPQTFAQMGTSISTYAHEIFTNIGDIFRNMGHSIAQTFTSIGSALGTTFKTVYNNVVGSLAPIGSFIQQNAGNILMTVAQVATTIQAIRWQTMFGMFKSGLSMFSQAFIGASKMIVGLTGVAAGFSLVSAAALTFGTLTTSEWNGLSEAIQKQDTLVGKLSAGYKWFTAQLSGATEKAVEFVTSFDVEGFIGKATNLIGSLGDTIVAIVGGTTGSNGIADLGGRLLDNIFKGVLGNSSKIASNISKVFGSVMSSIQAYAPSIGQSLGTLLGKAMQYAGNNAGAFVETAFTIIESFINGLVSNKAQIVNGALKIVDALVEGIRSHGGNIVNGAMELVTMFVNGLRGRSGTIGNAAKTIIDPLIEGIQGNMGTLEGIAKEVFGSLMDTIKSVVADGISNILDMVGNASLALAGILGGIAVALSFVPGMQLISAQLGASAISLGVLGGGLKVGSSLLENYSENTLQATSALSGFNAEAGKGTKFVPEADFSQFESELNQFELEKMWANNEIVYTVKTNSDGSTEEVAYKVQRLKDEQGNITYELVVEESGNTGTQIVDENKSYAESNPAQQLVNGKDDGSVKGIVDSNKSYAQENPVEQGFKFITDEDIEKERTAAEMAKKEEEAIKEFMANNDNTVELNNLKMSLGSGVVFDDSSYSAVEKAFSDKMSAWTDSGVMVNYDVLDTNLATIADSFKYLESVINGMPDDWGISDAQLSSLKELMNFDLSSLVVNDPASTIDNFNAFASKVRWFADSLSSSDGIQVKVTWTEDGKPVVEEVKQEASELDGTTATVTVNESGAEETKSTVDGVNASLDKMDSSKSVEVTTDTDTMGIQELGEALSKMQDSYSVKIQVLVSGLPDIENLKSVLSNASSGFGILGANNNIITVTAKTSGGPDVDTLKNKIDAFSDKFVTVTAATAGEAALDSLKSKMDEIQSKTVTVTVVTEESDQNAAGTYNFGGGWTTVNERGGELINLPSGTQIIPHDLSLRQQYKKGFDTGQKRAQSDLEQFARLSAPNVVMSQLNASPSPVTQDNYDYSVHFSEGSIIVKVDNAKGDLDYEAAAEKIWYYIDKKQKRYEMARRKR